MNQLLASLRRIVSYAMPLTRRVKTAYSGTVEITMDHGHKTLDTAHANYSYGSLQRVLRYGLQFTQPETAKQVLVLGLGGGSVVEVLRKTPAFKGDITAVELDPVIVQIADEEFNVRSDETLHIVCADAFAWVPTAPEQSFDLIIIDLFLDLTLPTGLSSGSFWEHIARVVQPNGRVLFNSLTANSVLIDQQPADSYWAQHGFEVKEVEVELLNLLYILRRVA
ncbi:fused MFS/spermidine synthase [Hymenobacter taeanensis]|uniref:Fused MFS/spermidine synthase n=1 Tax=Hymenobacter taeanensis TaxID=2735321 RepID=A0A6M6BCM9_9BACT|nr:MULTISPECIES: fused MFS/spermidine synthase [Hymenobacter]QJX46211.1 fused MFS/spermidine synthase [Hymenobacter taeanensis]UOQ80067.1 fused MFS/spermidine synthase [Hymenobacter sp. 5414T-23]